MTKYTPPFMKIIEFQSKFVLVGMLNPDEAAEQINYFRTNKGFRVEYQRPFGGSVLIISLAEDKEDLKKLYEIYEPLSRGYRGSYQAFAIGIVKAYRNLPDSQKE
jgi:hypothetical protein